jgi:putative Ca2+/H+ antiporter (TMEM165/GDT1 family)
MLARSRALPVSRVRLPGRAGETFGPWQIAAGPRALLLPSRPGTENVYAFLLALGVVFLAELGDKSQLLALTLAARRPAAQVLAGVALAALLLQGLTAGLGAALASAVPMGTVAVVAATSMFVAGLLTLRRSDDPPALTPARAGSTVLLSFGALLVAEIGDKTMLATAALAARESPLPTWLGGTAGFVLADALAVLAGLALLRRLPVRAVRLGTAALLATLGAVLLLGLL